MTRYYLDCKLNARLKENPFPLMRKKNLEIKRLLPLCKTIFIHKIIAARGEDENGVKNKRGVKNIRILEIAIIASEKDLQNFLSKQKEKWKTITQ